MTPRVKICCIGSIEEAWMAIRYGASAIGLVSEMPSGPGVISEDLIARIAAAIPPSISSFLLTSKQEARSIIAQHRRCGASTIQIVDRLGPHLEKRDQCKQKYGDLFHWWVPVDESVRFEPHGFGAMAGARMSGADS